MVGEQIKKRRIELGLTQEELAKKLGYKSNTTINKIELGINDITQSKVIEFAKALNTTPAYIMGWNTETKPNRIKVYGSVPAGIPIEAVEDIVDWEDVPQEWIDRGDRYIGLKVKGNSMYPKYIEDDTVIVKLQPDCECGQDAVVYVNGYEATLKKVVKQQDGIMLQPLNPEYTPKFYPYGPEEPEIRVLGIVVEIRRKV